MRLKERLVKLRDRLEVLDPRSYHDAKSLRCQALASAALEEILEAAPARAHRQAATADQASWLALQALRDVHEREINERPAPPFDWMTEADESAEAQESQQLDSDGHPSGVTSHVNHLTEL